MAYKMWLILCEHEKAMMRVEELMAENEALRQQPDTTETTKENNAQQDS